MEHHLNVQSPSIAESQGYIENNENIISNAADFQEILAEIDVCQNEINLFNEDAAEEIFQVEKKYNRLREVYFNKRNEIISKIANFWTITFLNNQDIIEILEQDEADTLRYLNELKVEEFEDIKFGYRIIFHFYENPYFENDVLIKEFHPGCNGNHTTIHWKPGVREPENHSTMDTRPRSFFHWFISDTELLSNEIGDLIKYELWLNPLKYYLGLDMEVENEIEPNNTEEGLIGDEDEEHCDTQLIQG